MKIALMFDHSGHVFSQRCPHSMQNAAKLAFTTGVRYFDVCNRMSLSDVENRSHSLRCCDRAAWFWGSRDLPGTRQIRRSRPHHL